MNVLNSKYFQNVRFVSFMLGILIVTFCVFFILLNVYSASKTERNVTTSVAGACPPFHLLNEKGQIINPISGVNVDKPYSPKKTCGACHDYEKITKGYHFTQGAGENPTTMQAERCLWATTPGNYGGTWCSPAPLYRYLSPKHNTTARTMDMTSFSFITVGCGGCHPGGGSAEYDRNGNRYDQFMKQKGFTSGGNNDFDGDYYQARWSETGVLEADCMICHLPEYNNAERKKQLKQLNFRWASTAAAGFATITGSVQNKQSIKIEYKKSLFSADGKIEPHIVTEPRDRACLFCHAKPGWKKRGANFRSRTDVHIRAGLKCVDCHPAGMSAVDERIRGKEIHQFGKGDDPGGHVRDDLDNTCRDCADCHTTGYLGATIAKHKWLPPLHLDKIACQTCHIPQRTVKAAQFQAGDVFNPGTKIPTKGKHLWTFYGPDMNYWNHYGDLEMMGYDDKPTDPFTPVLAQYKGKIYPLNRVHSAWAAIEIEGASGLMQPKMGDIYKMWTTHFKDTANYPELSKIKDDNDDGVIEVNQAEEIDALIAAVTSMLKNTNYPMDGKRVVWTMDDRIYSSGNEFRTIPKEDWEASLYGNVHKYNHDVYPAQAALGMNGCCDCHAMNSSFFFADIVQYPFNKDAKSVTIPQYKILGMSHAFALLGAVRESYIKPLMYFFILLFCCVFIGWAFKSYVNYKKDEMPAFLQGSFLPVLITIGALVGAFIILIQPPLKQFALPSQFWLEANHFLISSLILVIAFVTAFQAKSKKLSSVLFGIFVVSIIFGILMLIKMPFLAGLTRLSYSIFDASLMLLALGTLWIFIQKLFEISFNSAN